MNTQAFTPEATQARIQHEGLRSKIMTAEQAAELIQPGFNVGMSGFTGSGYPKAVPLALAARMEAAHAAGKPFRVPVDGRFHRAGAGRRAGQGRRHQHAAALSV